MTRGPSLLRRFSLKLEIKRAEKVSEVLVNAEELEAITGRTFDVEKEKAKVRDRLRRLLSLGSMDKTTPVDNPPRSCFVLLLLQ